MTDQQPEGTQGAGTGAQQGGNSNPPYAQYLEKFTDPETRSLAEQAFKEWDGNTTQRFQQLHSEYQNKYSAIDPLLNDYDAEDLQVAVSIAQQLQSDPEAFIANVQAALGNGDSEQGFGDPGEFDSDDPYDQRFSALENALTQIVEKLNSSEQMTQQEREDKALDDALSALHEEHGDFDDDFILAKAIKYGGDLDKAVAEWTALQEKVATNKNRPAPRPLGAGGGLPSSDIDPTSLSDKDTKDLVRKILDEANSS